AKARDDARILAKDGKPLDAYDFLAAQALPLRRIPFFAQEAEPELRSLKRAVEAALESGARNGPPDDPKGERVALAKRVPEAKRALMACEFDKALDCYRQLLALPLSDQERLDFQWRIFDIGRARGIFKQVIERIQETAGGQSKKTPLQLTIF